ncbi:MAG: hypothetical protein JSS98_01935 [Bacteroidetes bacterium]|nr:hypothetical protein [Bacteroidota bacterium]
MNPLSKEQLLEQYDLLKTEYIKLLNDKDVLLQWGKPQLEALYNTRIGYLQIERLQLQLRIRALKRKIELVRAAINQNKKVDITEIELQVASELAEAESRIMNEVAKLENSKNLLSHLESPQRSAELRNLYKQFAKQLHPDVNENLTDEQINLWYLVKEAYENGDLEKLKAMQVVYEKELMDAGNKVAELTEEEITLRMEVLKEGIKILNEQIVQIRSEFPFTMEQQIKDEDWVNEQSEELKKELNKLAEYENELTQQYQQMINVL